MRELSLIADESTATSLVFRLIDADQEDFFVELDEATCEALRTLIDAQASTSETPETPETPEIESAEPRPEPREIDPRLSTPLRMRPREIQDRIRSGATIAEVAEENGVTEARVEPFAHPVLIERARIAEMAKQAHPVREDGPAKLTLWEVLATAFAARGGDLSTSTWDAYKDTSGQWVVRVMWKAGLSDNVAEWSYHQQSMSSATAVARNAVAADLTDPDFGTPSVRSLSAVHRQDEEDAEDVAPGAEESTTDEGEDFLQHPDEQPRPTKRRRKAVTPHWEDVLLGVRTNTKRPRS